MLYWLSFLLFTRCVILLYFAETLYVKANAISHRSHTSNQSDLCATYRRHLISHKRSINYLHTHVQPMSQGKYECTMQCVSRQMFGLIMPKSFRLNPTGLAQYKDVFLVQHRQIPLGRQSLYQRRTTALVLYVLNNVCHVCIWRYVIFGAHSKPGTPIVINDSQRVRACCTIYAFRRRVTLDFISPAIHLYSFSVSLHRAR